MLNAPPGGSYLISTRPPTPSQLRIARILGVVLLGAFCATFAFRDVQLARQDAFVPIANTIIIINDAITAALLYTQFSVTRHRALLVLASGFLFKAFVLIPHALSFPGAFAPAGLLGAQVQTTAYLFQAQHLVFLLTAIGYTILRGRPDDTLRSDGRPVVPVVASISVVTTAVVILTFVTTAGGLILPPIMADLVHTTGAYQRVGKWIFILISCGSILVFRRRPTSMIDLWLQVAIWSWVFETLLAAIVPGRYSLVFYMSRSIGVVSSSFVLIAFLSESLMLHRRLVLAMAAREQEREGHRTAIDIIVGSLAHELRQPLSSILVNESAGSRLIAAEPPEREEVAEVFADIRGSALRANEIIDSVRSMYAASPPDRAPIDVNDLASQAVELMRIELETHRIAVDLQLSPGLSPIQGHGGQLLEVLLNGLKNAVDSLVGVSDRPRELRVRTDALERGGLSISIGDCGGGLDPRMRDRLFEPFHSTKAGGMGLGLSICRSIVVAHGGTLSLTPSVPHGAVFRVELPASNALGASRTNPAKVQVPSSRAHA